MKTSNINKGIYLYCIRSKTDSFINATGIDNVNPVSIIKYKNLEAVTSEINLDEFSSEETKRKAAEDVNWIREKAILHEFIIEAAMKKNGTINNVIPMRFGTVFKNHINIIQSIKKNYLFFCKTIKGLEKKQEWGLKIYLKDSNKFKKSLMKEKIDLMSDVKNLKSMSKGRAYFYKKQIDAKIDLEINNFIEKYMLEILLKVKKHANSCKRGKILESGLTGKPYQMVLNTFYLINEKNIERFISELKQISKTIKLKGFFLEYSGPWPAYNFVKM